ncbi:hypothetical protein [Winogradskyella aurantia]|uniref:Uncharacterized protein n=1 Tax=Winogradskyella aurantia TaxID=1915063 RepID=A0A265URY3_9FLAO|nr:hypothetical protein [Winogradskyella aurantia]OZV68061.1 hypothetical protein CA834_10465 [Winogradskyella aurantia]
MKNQTGRYFKYAVGEIILVVIGILIALQVNNWNNDRNDIKANKNLMGRLLFESQKNKKAVEENLESIESLMKDCETLLGFIGTKPAHTGEKTIDTLIYSILTSPDLIYKGSTLNEALNSGQLSLILSDSLRDYLYQIPSLYSDIKRTEDVENLDGSNNFVPFLYDNISLRQIDYRFAPIKERIGKSKLSQFDNRVILKSRKFESMVDNKMFLLNNMKRKNLAFNIVNDSIIKLLKAEIEKIQ